jgi:uncharacterized linocin/CFP29 family protein
MPDGPTVDVILPDGNGGFTAQGSVAQRMLQGGFDVSVMRPLAILRKEEWLFFDEKVVQVTRQRLRAVADLLGGGLTFPLANPMGTTVLQWERSSDMTPAERSMDGLSRTRDDRVEFDQQNLPIYITHKDFSLNLRHLEASRKLGQPLDATEVEIATRRVNDNLEDALVNGLAGYTVAGNTGYGYTTHPNRNTYELAAGSWLTATGTQILADVLNMITVAHQDNFFGPFVIYVPTDYWVALLADFKTESDKTILSRIMEIPDVQDVRVLDTLTSNQVIFVQLTTDVVEEVVGFQPQLVQWEEQGGFKINFKVLAIMVPRLKSDFNGNMGLVHASTASGGG